MFELIPTLGEQTEDKLVGLDLFFLHCEQVKRLNVTFLLILFFTTFY